jgi:hypothetical protein
MTQLEKEVARMRMWRMRHTFHHPRLLLMGGERALQVAVVVGLQKFRMKKRKEKMRALRWRKPIHPTMSTWGHTSSHNPKILDGGKKISYKGKTEVVREKMKENPKLHAREATDYIFHTFFQQDFYDSVIITKGKPVAIS